MKRWLPIVLALTMLCAMVSVRAEEAVQYEPLTVTVAFVDNGLWDVDPDNTYFGKEIKERFNLEVEPMVVTWGDWETKTSMWAASGQLPDYCMTSTSDYFVWRDQGITRGFEVSVFDQYPNLKDRIPMNMVEYLVDDDCLIYGVPHGQWKTSSQPVSATALYVNKAFLEQAGLDSPPTTLDGWYDFLKTCVDEDFSGLGTIGMTADAAIPCTYITQFPFLPYYNWAKTDDGWTLKQLLADENIEMLEYGRKLYQAGIIDPEIATRKSGDAQQLFNEGRVAVTLANSDCDMMLQYPGPDKTTAAQWITMTYGPESPIDGKRYHDNLPNYDFDMTFPYDISDEKMERILTVMDWACSPEGEEFVTLGVKDVHYTIHEDGTYENLCRTDDGTLQAYWIHEPFAMFGRFVTTWNFEFAVTSPLHPADNIAMAQQYLEELRSNAEIVPANWGIEFYSSDARSNMPSISADYTAMYLKAITGTDDIAQLYEDFRSQALVKVQEAIDDTNAYAAEMGW